MPRRRSSAFVLCCLLLTLRSAMAAEESVDAFADVWTIFRQHCAECHSADERNGGLSFDDKASLYSEADSGRRPVIPGEPAESELIRRITSTLADVRMPPEGEPLSVQQVDRLKNWVSRGAPWSPSGDEMVEPTTTSEHWSFQPVADPEPPPVNSETWSAHPVDRFIQSRQESAGLQPTVDAEPVVLIRRATYALTGLPPTPDEIRRFLDAVESPQGLEGAFADVIDELLARPSYGERWGRHWMDWVRYADTAGDNSDFPIPQAYLYRNYIIESLNRDVPYDRFVTEQIAGDLLPADSLEEQNRQTIATGYLAMARRFGSLVERYPWHLTIEDTIDNVGRTLLGLTLSCARCHDHKFDPVTTRDYYGLYGIFASTRYPFPGLELFQTPDDLVPLIREEDVARAFAPYQEQTDRLRNELDELLAACEERAIQDAADGANATLDEQRRKQNELDVMLIQARKAGEKLAAHLKTIPPIPSAYAVQDGEPQDAPVQIKGEPSRPGAVVPRRFPEILGGHRLADDVAKSTSGRRELARWITSPENPLTARVIVNRVWQRHFGVGIVHSTSDFGLRGQLPTHPELLDWLAQEFVRSGWSIKQLQRTIMTSRTYRLSSLDVDENLKRDPGNQLYWKFPRQRLDAESIRDTLLMVSGSLDSTPQTEPYDIPPHSKWKYTQHHPFNKDFPTNKRSVYQLTRRLTVSPYLQTFDGPDPNVCTSDRDQSVTSLQALYFINSEFVHEQAGLFAEKILATPGDDAARVHLAFLTLLCRPPTTRETGLLLRHLEAAQVQLDDGTDGRQQAWSSLIRSLFRLNEFLYVD